MNLSNNIDFDSIQGNLSAWAASAFVLVVLQWKMSVSANLRKTLKTNSPKFVNPDVARGLRAPLRALPWEHELEAGAADVVHRHLTLQLSVIIIS